MDLPYTPTNKAYADFQGGYCAIGWQLHCAGKTDQDLANCSYDLIPDPHRVYHEESADLKGFNKRLMEIYSTNNDSSRDPVERYETAYKMSEQLKADMPKEWGLFVACFNGIPPEIDPEVIDD